MLTDVYMQKAINGNSTGYCSKEEVKLWYGKKGHSHNCYAEEHKKEEIVFFWSVSNPVARGLKA